MTYSAQGDSAYPKESFTLFASGLVAEVFNFLELRVYRGRKEHKSKYSSKGHAEQMAAWLGFLKAQSPHPFPYEQSRPGMLVTFAVLESIQKGQAVAIQL